MFVLVRVWLRRRGPKLGQALADVSIDRLQNVLVPDGMGGQIQVEHVLLTAHGLVVIDVKAFEGTIFASDRMAEWTVIGAQGRFTFPNPLGTLYDRVAALRQLVRDVPVVGIRAVRRGRGLHEGPAEGRRAARQSSSTNTVSPTRRTSSACSSRSLRIGSASSRRSSR